MSLQVVLTADIVNSSRLDAGKDQQLIKQLKEIFAKQQLEFYRGDSFQVYISNPEAALKLALLARATAIGLLKEEHPPLTDIRLSLGIGQVQTPVRSLNTAKGAAFVLSGRKFDEISKTSQRLAISTSNPLANEGLAVISDYLDTIFGRMSSKQAEVIAELLKGALQKDVAKKYKKTVSTIHQRLSAARWEEIEKLLQQYKNIIHLIA